MEEKALKASCYATMAIWKLMLASLCSFVAWGSAEFVKKVIVTQSSRGHVKGAIDIPLAFVFIFGLLIIALFLMLSSLLEYIKIYYLIKGACGGVLPNGRLESLGSNEEQV